MKTKPFDKKLHKKYDEIARQATKEYVKRTGFTAVDNPDPYGADLIVRDLGYLECEVKKHWHTDHYPYKWIRLPYRKKKFSTLSMPVVFYIWNSCCTHAVRIPGSKLCTAEIKEYKNSKVPEGEMFFWFEAKTLDVIRK